MATLGTSTSGMHVHASILSSGAATAVRITPDDYMSVDPPEPMELRSAVDEYNAEVERIRKGIWITENGTEIHVLEMDQTHLRNAAQYVKKHPERYYCPETWRRTLLQSLWKMRAKWPIDWAKRIMYGM